MAIRERILEVFKRQFKVSDVDALGLAFEHLRMGSLEQWDSLENMNLLLEIENEFSVRLSMEDMSSIDSLAGIEAYLTKQASSQ